MIMAMHKMSPDCAPIRGTYELRASAYFLVSCSGADGIDDTLTPLELQSLFRRDNAWN